MSIRVAQSQELSVRQNDNGCLTNELPVRGDPHRQRPSGVPAPEQVAEDHRQSGCSRFAPTLCCLGERSRVRTRRGRLLRLCGV